MSGCTTDRPVIEIPKHCAHLKWKRIIGRTFLMVQWLRFPVQGTWGLIPGRGTRSHVPQPRVHMLQLKTLHAAAETWFSQIID